jgi:hypothetical protein
VVLFTRQTFEAQVEQSEAGPRKGRGPLSFGSRAVPDYVRILCVREK